LWEKYTDSIDLDLELASDAVIETDAGLAA
jgi:hypothetical protein